MTPPHAPTAFSFPIDQQGVVVNAHYLTCDAARGRSVYVVVSTQDWTKRQIRPALREALQ